MSKKVHIIKNSAEPEQSKTYENDERFYEYMLYEGVPQISGHQWNCMFGVVLAFCAWILCLLTLAGFLIHNSL